MSDDDSYESDFCSVASSSELNESQVSFCDELKKAWRENGFEINELHSSCFAYAMKGQDVICHAHPGSGKTSLVAATIIQRIVTQERGERKGVGALVLVPTAELALQWSHEIVNLCHHLPKIKTVAYFAESDIETQKQSLKTVHPTIVVTTPTRAAELIASRSLHLNAALALAVDECDLLLQTPESHAAIESILADATLQVLLCGSTINAATMNICRFMTKDSVLEYTTSALDLVDSDALTHHRQTAVFAEKNAKLLNLLLATDYDQAIVFVKEPGQATIAQQLLDRNDIASVALQSTMSVDERIAALQQFQSAKSLLRVLVTDTSLRGLAFKRVQVVVNFDVPTPLNYVHRVGRINGTGLVFSFTSNTEEENTYLRTVSARYGVRLIDVPANMGRFGYVNGVNAEAGWHNFTEEEQKDAGAGPVDVVGLQRSLISAVCAALICEPKSGSSGIAHIASLVRALSATSPEFVLKLALYVRDDLGIRTTANYMVALAACSAPCQPFLRFYVPAIVRLPSDWLEIVTLYSQIAPRSGAHASLPSSLRKGLIAKFAAFDAHSLSKYNKEKSASKKAKANEDVDGAFTLKRMVRTLHISEPREHVFCLLGKKYPATREAFVESGLPGTFDPARADKRMKLPVAETWETQISARGNKAEVWHDLIDHHKLPFMAMMRNLRNMILAGINRKHHAIIQGTLKNEGAVANSRQFPFRFLSAFEAIDLDVARLEQELNNPPPPPAARGGRGGRGGRGAARGGRGGRGGGSGAGGRPDVMKHSLTVAQLRELPPILAQYREALDAAVKIATVHNIKPIHGRTVVLCQVGPKVQVPCASAGPLGSVRQVEDVAILLALMFRHACEDCEFRIFSGCSPDSVAINIQSDNILQSVKEVQRLAKQDLPMGNGGGSTRLPLPYLDSLVRDRKRVDNLVVLADTPFSPAEDGVEEDTGIKRWLGMVRQELNPDLLYVSVDLCGRSKNIQSGNDLHPNDVMMTGFSDQILRFVAERGSDGQLDYINRIHEAKGVVVKALKPLAGPATISRSVSGATTYSHTIRPSRRPPSAPAGQWLSLRVFISSTFRDMHGERDELSKLVFPALRSKCAALRVSLIESDLRWGVTEDSNSLQMCLQELDRCSAFVGLIGDRLGYVPDQAALRETANSGYEWLADEAVGSSVTMLEFEHFRRHKHVKNSLMYLRDSTAIASIPMKYQSTFTETAGSDAQAAVLAYKDRLRSLEASKQAQIGWDGYPSTWKGVVDGKPCLGGLAPLCEQLSEDLWSVVYHLSLPSRTTAVAKPIPYGLGELAAAAQYHDTVIDAQMERFVGRSRAVQQIRSFAQGQSAGGDPKVAVKSFKPEAAADNADDAPEPQLLVVNGVQGSGKTATLAAAAKQLAESESAGVAVATHFVGAGPASTDMRQMIKRLMFEVVASVGLPVEPLRVSPSADLHELRTAFEALLARVCAQACGLELLIVVDGVDELDDPTDTFDKRGGYAASDKLLWVPDALPPGCRIVVSASDTAHCSDYFKRVGQPENVMTMKALTEAERGSVVNSTLKHYHKSLSATSTNNQLKIVTSKTDGGWPLYLVVACEEVRLFGVHEQLTERLRQLPPTTSGLFNSVLQRLEADCGQQLVSHSLGILLCSRGGVTESEMLGMLKVADKTVVPSQWTRLYHQLAPFLRARHSEGDLLAIDQAILRDLCAKRYLPYGPDRARVHGYLGRYFYASADPSQDGAWEGVVDWHSPSAKRVLGEVVFHLISAGLMAEVKATLTDLLFVEYKCRAGLLPSLLDDFEAAMSTRWNGREAVAAMWDFVVAGAHILASLPSLVPSLAANQPDHSVVARLSTEHRKTQAVESSWLQWVNKPQTPDDCISTVQAASQALLAVGLSHDNALVAVGGRDWRVRVFDTASGQPVHVLKGHKNMVTAVSFSPKGIGLLASCSADEAIKIWSVVSGRCMRTLKGHRKGVNCIMFSPTDPKGLLLSGSDDTSLRLWVATEDNDKKGEKGARTERQKGANAGTPTELRYHGAPVTSVAFHNDGRMFVSGAFNGTVVVYDMQNNEQKAKFHSTPMAVRSVAFSPTMAKIVAASFVDGSLALYDAASELLLNTMRGHADAVSDCSFSPNGEMLLSASDDGSLRVWNASTVGKTTQMLLGHSLPVRACSFAKDGKRVLSASADGSVKFWTATGEKEAVPMHQARVTAVSASLDGSVIASTSFDGDVRMWDGASGKPNAVIENCHDNRPATACVVSADGAWVISGGHDATIRVWSSRTTGAGSARFHATLDGHSDAVAGLACVDWPVGVGAQAHSGGEQRIASASIDGTVRVWSLTPDGKGKLMSTLAGHSDWVTGVAFSPTNRVGGRRWLVSSSYDHSLIVWANTDPHLSGGGLDDWQMVTSLDGHSNWVSNVSFSPDGSRLVSSSYDGMAIVWDVTSPDATAWVPSMIVGGRDGPIMDACFSANSQFFATACKDGIARVYDRHTGALVSVFVCGSPALAVSATTLHSEALFSVGDAMGHVHVLRLHAGTASAAAAARSSVSASATSAAAQRPMRWVSGRVGPADVGRNEGVAGDGEGKVEAQGTAGAGVPGKKGARGGKGGANSVLMAAYAAHLAFGWNGLPMR